MRAVFGLVLVLGMGLAGFAVYMVKGFVSEQQTALAREQQKTAQAVDTVEVYAVNRVIAYGETLTKDDVVLIQYAKPYLPEGVFQTEEELFPKGDDELRVVLRPMEMNEPVLAVKVTEPGDIAGITSLLAPGMRAFTIKVDVQTGVSGFLRPSDRVDVYWTGTLRSGNNGRGESVTTLIKSAIEIIAIDQTADGNRTGEATVARTITVQVSPQDVAALAQAQTSGSLSLALVGSGDVAENTSVTTDMASILGIVEEVVLPAAPVIEAVPEEVCYQMQLRDGARTSTGIEIPCP